ncbi:MAG: trigger factor [Henriciella sp.]|jgi:trigger factor|uniref:trigger factor n=1 Tax=Henriciella sp. TaxID=1968823 RepID=UPI000C0F446E|nr:trigger factor [Henriciella sp.]MBF34031.1 trigger factor [Hyphomonadaceae bacterium]MBK73903.1 trigger factor [Henriciella sp.]PHR81772.1 MAG: trigger factor [Henriciella sp.]|tara:strand:+ start:1963 stop:3297 length:1335 start_codon:yes stop_codon:yes gene_type:complete
MECTETTDGLSRTYKVKVPASELKTRLDERIEEIRPQMRLKGFRPGKVPASHVRKMFGKSIMGEVVEAAMKESSEKAITDADVRPASQPDMHMESDMEKVLEGEEDLAYHMHVDVMPDFEPADMSGIKIKKPVAEVDDAQLEETLDQVAENNMKYEARGKTAKAREGDAVVIDFLGKIDGEPFEGGAAEGHTLVLGSGSFIPGFEDQLIGLKTGEEKDVEVTFPEEYQAEHLAGKAAVFEVKVNEVRAPKKPDIDEEFAKGLGIDSLEELKDMLKTQLQQELDNASRAKAKRHLLDALDERHDFELPPKMVNMEFDQIWQQLQSEMDAGRVSDEDKDKSEDELKEEYRKIAERRVRLGLVLAEIGRLQEIKISEQEVQQALIREAQRYPGQERQVLEFFQKNENAMAQLRAPIYEDKVVDHLLDTVEIEEEKVSREELLSEDEE